MSLNKLFILTLVLLDLLTVKQSAKAATGAGVTSANFLKIGAGARAASMGESFTAVANDGEAMAWNVAGLSQLIANELTLMHTEWLQNYKYEYMSYSQGLGDGQGIGGSIIYLHLDDLNIIGEQPSAGVGDVVGAVPYETGESANASDLALTVAYSRPVFQGAFAGLGLKYIQQTIHGSNLTGFAGDIGFLYLERSKGWSLGATLLNLGPAISGFPLPMTLRIGVAQRMRFSDLVSMYSKQDMVASKRRDILFTLDIAHTLSEGNLRAFLGGEWRYVFGTQYLAFRSGGKFDFAKNGRVVLSAGLGYVTLMTFGEMEFDYAYAPFGVLGDTHRLALSLRI